MNFCALKGFKISCALPWLNKALNLLKEKNHWASQNYSCMKSQWSVSSAPSARMGETRLIIRVLKCRLWGGNTLKLMFFFWSRLYLCISLRSIPLWLAQQFCFSSACLIFFFFWFSTVYNFISTKGKSTIINILYFAKVFFPLVCWKFTVFFIPYMYV